MPLALLKYGLVSARPDLPHFRWKQDLKRSDDVDTMNVVYDAGLNTANPPARACVEARLADPALRVEMTVVALL